MAKTLSCLSSPNCQELKPVQTSLQTLESISLQLPPIAINNKYRSLCWHVSPPNPFYSWQTLFMLPVRALIHTSFPMPHTNASFQKSKIILFVTHFAPFSRSLQVNFGWWWTLQVGGTSVEYVCLCCNLLLRGFYFLRFVVHLVFLL